MTTSTADQRTFTGDPRLAEEATALYEETRRHTAPFIELRRARSGLTSGTTGALNLLRFFLGTGSARRRDPPDEMEHHSNLVRVVSRQGSGAKIRHIRFTVRRRLDLTHLDELYGADPNRLSDARIQRAGHHQPDSHIADAAHAVGALVSVERRPGRAAPALDVRALGCEALSFSAHKMLSGQRVGVLG